MSDQKTKKNSQYSASFVKEALEDFETACISREASLLGRKEVLTGKAKFGIFGDGKEVAQVAMARTFQKGDFRSGYYRDQTFALASGLVTVQQLFAQLYAHADAEHEPNSAGRQMNAHFATPLVDKSGEWTKHIDLKNISSDISPTGGQMARALGLAVASKKYRETAEISKSTGFSHNGNEVSFCTIGDASTSEGVFWETVNAASVMQVPLAVFVWDDGYGISVPIKYQTTKASISEALKGFKPDKEGEGMDIYTVKGWNYAALRHTFEKGIDKVRKSHTPCMFHVQEVTQPQGHSTSGSHERYKSAERLQWEKDWDGILQMRNWLIEEDFATAEQLDAIAEEAKKSVRQAANRALEEFKKPIKANIQQTAQLLDALASVSPQASALQAEKKALLDTLDPLHRHSVRSLRLALRLTRGEQSAERQAVADFLAQLTNNFKEIYTDNLYSETPRAALRVAEIKPQYSEQSPVKNGFELMNACFDYHLTHNPSVFAFGEDVGHIGDVNQGFMGMQEKHGVHRVFDTGIREWTIVGQAIGMAMRGLRPIAELQYLDYLIYALSPLSDDMATVRYRTRGIQQAPAIIRTRGHRLEGIWHSGSPIGMILHSLRGICVLVPRDMTRAAGFYNTMLQSDDPALIIECLNGYRLKEQQPDNIGTFTVPVGVPEVLTEGNDVTLVTYGSCVRVAQEAMAQLSEMGISVELIDVQSLLPFDIHHRIAESVKKTNRLVCLDEDVPGGASAYMLQQILVEQKAYYHLDSEPITISAEAVRPAFGSDGDYFIKPSAEDVFERIYALMSEAEPARFARL